VCLLEFFMLNIPCGNFSIRNIDVVISSLCAVVLGVKLVYLDLLSTCVLSTAIHVYTT